MDHVDGGRRDEGLDARSAMLGMTSDRSRELALPAGCKPVERRLTASLLGSIPSPVSSLQAASTPKALRTFATSSWAR